MNKQCFETHIEPTSSDNLAGKVVGWTKQVAKCEHMVPNSDTSTRMYQQVDILTQICPPIQGN